MKKSVLIALFGAASVLASYGQGKISFATYYGSSQANGVTYGNGANIGLGVGPEISAELFYGASTATLTSQLTGISSSIVAFGINGVTGPAPLQSYNSSFPGTGLFSGAAVTVPGTAGSTYEFAIYAFGTVGGNFYSGWSAFFQGATQGGGSPLPTVPGLPSGLQNASFTVNADLAPVPEPSSLALAGLGGFGMLMAFRRKKA